MNWTKFLTYGDSPQNAFETLCNQLFERHLRRNYGGELNKFRVINGAGGDGGIEAYGELRNGEIIAIQAKWFKNSLDNSEISQIKGSINTAKGLRPQIKKYIICIPHDVNSLKIGRGNKPTKSHEENKINELIDDIISIYPDLELIWWFDNELLAELQREDNEGVHKYWFERELVSNKYIVDLFNFQKKGWLNERYIPELHGQGLIHKEYKKVCFSVEYRNKLFDLVKDVVKDLRFCISQIEKFIPTNQLFTQLNQKLLDIKNNLTLFYNELIKIGDAIKIGNDFYNPSSIPEVNLWETILELKKLKPENTQKNILPELSSSLESIHRYDLPQYIQQIKFNFKQSIRLILGEPGTGKTHGLANCVELHLAHNSPAIIIQAKGSSCSNWTEILSNALQITNWRMDEILSAFETLSIRTDVQKACSLNAGEEKPEECTKAIICIDGLEEDIENKEEWYSRIRECEQLSIKYPRVRFLFSARRYFYDNTKIPQKGVFDDVFLPREGDVSIMEIAPNYFSEKHYNIQLPSYSLIRSIDSLFALRLFCEEYKNRNISKKEKIVTATRDLINIKVDKANIEFRSSLINKYSLTRNPILDSLNKIAHHFYSNHEIEHNQLVDLIYPVINYLSKSDIDNLIDYYTKNGFLVMYEKVDEREVLNKKEFIYTITYQSIIEHIISEEIYHKIRNESLTKIPVFLHKTMLQPLEYAPKDFDYNYDIIPNQKIIQNIINNVFIETGQLIGENDFLAEGFNELEIKIFQLTAISHAPNNLALKFKSKIDDLFLSGHNTLSILMEHLIIPSSNSADSMYGAEYLHTMLQSFTSAFERDKLWSGFDDYEISMLPEKERLSYQYEIAPVKKLNSTNLVLFEWELHNESPLLFAWGLSTIDQEFRNSLRISLTDWAIKNPSEFHLLLKKVFPCNDPQIQEDLASIALGVASRLKNKRELKKLANWAIGNIFNNLKLHRNIIVRQGFRAIAEKAFQTKAISNEEIEICRPKPMKEITLLPLEREIYKGQEECYPIVHDLAWYVIKKAYENFLEYPSSIRKERKDNDCREAKKVLDKYRLEYNDKEIFAGYWGMSAAIAYIKNLGLTRNKGIGYTQASHGSKSKVFTYEEKYTWLAVHYLQGYLSDYIPVKNWSGKRSFIKDYSQITDIPNPAEAVIDIDLETKKIMNNPEWIIKEILSKELITSGNINDNISNWVNEEPLFDIKKWLSFDSEDFQLKEPTRKWTAIYNHTGLHDSKELCYASITFIACLIQKDDVSVFLEVLKNNSDSLHFITHLDELYASPRTDTYCNPTDIVWMNWIEEDEPNEHFYDISSGVEKQLIKTITQVIQNGVNGENYIKLPSKFLRELTKCRELVNLKLKDSSGITLSFVHKISDGSYKDNQEIVVFEKNTFEKALKESGYEVIWFVQLFKQKNPLNKSLAKEFHAQRTRKYFIWKENNEEKRMKFWDERFSNSRDKEIN